MVCSRCGSPIAPGARWCGKCGQTVGGSALTAPKSLERPGVITLLAILHFCSALLFIPSGLCVMLSPPSAMKASIIPLGFIGLITLVLGLAHAAAGWGLWRLLPWGRTVALVLAGLSLFAIPVGTIIGSLLLYYFTRPGIAALFSGRSPSQFTQQELASIKGLTGVGTVVAVVVGILALVAVAGIVAAIAVPNLLTASERARQHRTMDDMRTINVALDKYYDDKHGYPMVANIDALAGQLEPKYMEKVPRLDGWSHDFRYYGSTCGGNTCGNFVLASGGKDGVFEVETLPEYTKKPPSTKFDADIVLANGEWLRAPELSK
jgi:type II secretory pathway pseudopilin PulG